MTLKEFLGQASDIDGRINCKLEQLSELRSKAAVSKSFVTVSSGNREQSSVERLIEKIYTLEEKINGEIDFYVDTKSEIVALLDCLSRIELRNVMELHFINGHSWEKVSEILDISPRQVYNIYKTALNELEPIYQKKTERKK